MKHLFPGIVFLALLVAACHHSEKPVTPHVTPPVVTIPDSSYRIEKIVLSPGKIVTFQYDSTGRISQSTLTDSLKNTYGILAQDWKFVYDSQGHLKELAGGSDHNIAIKTDDSGYITQAVRTTYGNFLFQTTLRYDSLHQMTMFKYLTMGSGQTYSFHYNASGDLTLVDRSGTPSSLNYEVEAIDHDDQKSLWQTTTQNHYIHWWLMCLTYFADQSPALLLSYQHNVAHAVYTDIGGNQDTLNLLYNYQKSFPTSVKSIRKDSSLFRGPYQIFYQAYPLP